MIIRFYLEEGCLFTRTGLSLPFEAYLWNPFDCDSRLFSNKCFFSNSFDRGESWLCFNPEPNPDDFFLINPAPAPPTAEKAGNAPPYPCTCSIGDLLMKSNPFDEIAVSLMIELMFFPIILSPIPTNKLFFGSFDFISCRGTLGRGSILWGLYYFWTITTPLFVFISAMLKYYTDSLRTVSYSSYFRQSRTYTCEPSLQNFISRGRADGLSILSRRWGLIC